MPSMIDATFPENGIHANMALARQNWDTAALEVNVGGYLQAIYANDVERLMQDRLRDFVEVGDFSGGDDKSRIQRALDAVGNKEWGGAALLPNGAYNMTSGLVLPPRTFLVGYGQGSVLLHNGNFDLITCDPDGELFGVANIGIDGQRPNNTPQDNSLINFALNDDASILGDSVWGIDNSRFIITGINSYDARGSHGRFSGAGGGQIVGFRANRGNHDAFVLASDDVFCSDMKLIGIRARGYVISGASVKMVGSKGAITGINDDVASLPSRGVCWYITGNRCTIESTYGQDSNGTMMLVENSTGHNITIYSDAAGQAHELISFRDEPYHHPNLGALVTDNVRNSLFRVGARDRGARNGASTGEFSRFAPPQLDGSVILTNTRGCQIYCCTEDEALDGSFGTNGIKKNGGLNENNIIVATRRNNTPHVEGL